MDRTGGILWLTGGAAAPVLRYPRSALLVIGGPSGVGKSTLAERVLRGSGAVPADPDAVRAQLAEERGVAVGDVAWPEALARTRERYGERLAAGRGAVVITTAVRRGHRLGLARDAAGHGAEAHLLMLDGDRELCRAGRAAQDGQRIPDGLFEHLVREWAAFRRALADPRDPERVGDLFASVPVLDRPAADALERIELAWDDRA